MGSRGAEGRSTAHEFGAWVDWSQDAEPCWYAFRTRPRSEKQTDQHMRLRGIDCYLPLLASERQWHDRKKVVALPLFPGYVFARVSSREIVRVRAVPGVVDVVRVEGRPVPAADAEIENVRRLTTALTVAEVVPEPTRFAQGERVRVVTGPFAGVEGVVHGPRGAMRFAVWLDVLGQGVEVNIGADRIEAVGSA